MHPCLFRVPKLDKATQKPTGSRMCGKKATVAYKVGYRWSAAWRQVKTICFCPDHAPNTTEAHSFTESALQALSYARHAEVTNHGVVPIESVRDSRIEVAMDNLVDSFCGLMNTRKNSWATDSHWKEVFERSIVERAVRSVVES
jgi:hypothetical protein